MTCLFVARRGEEESKEIKKKERRRRRRSKVSDQTLPKNREKGKEKINGENQRLFIDSVRGEQVLYSKSLSPKPIFTCGLSGVERECDLFGKREIHFFFNKKKKKWGKSDAISLLFSPFQKSTKRKDI